MACFAAVIDAKCEKGTKWELSGKETFVKVELVGIDVPTQRMRTAPCKCGDTGVAVGQTLQLDVQPESTELQLCGHLLLVVVDRERAVLIPPSQPMDAPRQDVAYGEAPTA